MKIPFITLLILVISLLLNSCIHAQEIALSVSPPLVEFMIQPGKTVLVAYTAENNGDPVTVSSHMYSFTPSNNTGGLMIKPLSGPIRFELENSAITLGQKVFLNSKAREQFLLRIRVPEGAPTGDYYYTFMVETDAGSGKDGETVSRAQASVGANILITVTPDGAVEQKGSIKTFAIGNGFSLPFFKNTPLFQSGTPLPVSLELSNTGNSMIHAKGSIKLQGRSGEKRAFTIADTAVLANSARLLSATPSASLDCRTDGSCPSSTGLVIDQYLIGSYSIGADIAYGDEGSLKIYSSKNMLVLPLRELAGVVIVCIVIFQIVRKGRRHKL